MIVWTGFGILVPVVTFACLVAVGLPAELAFGKTGFLYVSEHVWPISLGFALAAAVMVPIARRLKEPEARVMVDEQTGERLLVGEAKHTFFFIPLRYWPALLFGIALLTAVIG